jgi:hypothetical protein
MIVSIHQPSYFPWLGLLHKICGSDVFVVMDEVQLNDGAYQHRNQFLTEGGQVKLLSIPFVRKGYLERRFRDLPIASADWRVKHRDFIRANYRRHPCAAEILPAVETYFATEHSSLFEAVLESMRLCFRLLGTQAKILLQSEMDYDRSLHRGDLVLALARSAGADVYLSGTGARAYLDEAAFGRGLSLRYDDFVHPVYPQKNASAFVPGLSCLDLLFNVGAQQGGELVRGKHHA